MLGQHVEKVVGPNKFPAGTEASLDIEYIMSVGAKVCAVVLTWLAVMSVCVLDGSCGFDYRFLFALVGGWVGEDVVLEHGGSA